jgi:hypothetical protein
MMPYRYTIDVAQQVIRTRLWGSVTGAELRALRDHLSADPEFRPNLSVLIDVSDATTELLNAADIQGLASTSKFDEGSRRAFVVPDAASFGLARMFDSYRQTRDGREQTAVFRTLAEAEQWLAERPRGPSRQQA